MSLAAHREPSLIAWIIAAAVVALAAPWLLVWQRARICLGDVDAAWRQVDALLDHRREVVAAFDGALQTPALTAACDASRAARDAAPEAVAAAELEVGARLVELDVPQGPAADLADVAQRLTSTLRVHAAEVARYEVARRRVPCGRWVGLTPRGPWPSDP